MALTVVEHKETLSLIARQGQGAAFPGKYVPNGTIADYERRAEIYREAGEIVNHSPKSIVFTPDYGYSLAYYGRLDHGQFWYLSPESKTVRKDFAAQYKEHSPRYAIVIKRFAYYPRQADWGGRGKGKRHKGLRTLLTKKYGVMAEDHSYIVFDLRETGSGKSKVAGRPAASGNRLHERIGESRRHARGCPEHPKLTRYVRDPGLPDPECRNPP